MNIIILDLEHADIQGQDDSLLVGENKIPKSKEANDCTCNAEKSVRFNLPIKNKTSTNRNENKASVESTCKIDGRYQRSTNGNSCREGCIGSFGNSCNTGKLKC